MNEKNNPLSLTRAFICLEMPEEVVKEIARVQELILKRKFVGKMTELENLHLTLKFLGEIDEEKIGRVKEILSKVDFSEFESKLGEIGIFSYNRNPKIVWVKINGKVIWEIQKKIDEYLSDLFDKEERFMNHMTIARVKYVNDKDNFSSYVKNINVKSLSWNVTNFKLKKSILSERGPIYEDIESFNLKKRI